MRLACHAALPPPRTLGISWARWEEAYTDLPSRQTKLKVADRGIITTADAERR